MENNVYTAWDGKQYQGPPPEGWYQAHDGQWWPEGYGPPPPAQPPAPSEEFRTDTHHAPVVDTVSSDSSYDAAPVADSSYADSSYDAAAPVADSSYVDSASVDASVDAVAPGADDRPDAEADTIDVDAVDRSWSAVGDQAGSNDDPGDGGGERRLDPDDDDDDLFGDRDARSGVAERARGRFDEMSGRIGSRFDGNSGFASGSGVAAGVTGAAAAAGVASSSKASELLDSLNQQVSARADEAVDGGAEAFKQGTDELEQSADEIAHDTAPVAERFAAAPTVIDNTMPDPLRQGEPVVETTPTDEHLADPVATYDAAGGVASDLGVADTAGEVLDDPAVAETTGDPESEFRQGVDDGHDVYGDHDVDADQVAAVAEDQALDTAHDQSSILDQATVTGEWTASELAIADEPSSTDDAASIGGWSGVREVPESPLAEALGEEPVERSRPGMDSPTLDIPPVDDAPAADEALAVGDSLAASTGVDSDESTAGFDHFGAVDQQSTPDAYGDSAATMDPSSFEDGYRQDLSYPADQSASYPDAGQPPAPSYSDRDFQPPSAAYPDSAQQQPAAYADAGQQPPPPPSSSPYGDGSDQRAVPGHFGDGVNQPGPASYPENEQAAGFAQPYEAPQAMAPPQQAPARQTPQPINFGESNRYEQQPPPAMNRRIETPPPRRGWLKILIGLLLLIAAVALGYLAFNQFNDTTGGGDPTAAGGLENPHPSTQPVSVFWPVGDGVEQRWLVKVEAMADADAQALAGATVDEGQSLVGAQLLVLNQNGADPADSGQLQFKAVSSGGTVYDPTDCPAGSPLGSGAVGVSDQVQGNVCWAVDSGDVDGLMLGIRSSEVPGTIHVLLP